MSLPSEPESDDAFVISSETGESSDQSDSILSPRPGTKKRKARLKRRTTKRRAPPPPADDSDESISEGILGTGRRRRGASSAGASSGGTAKDKGKGKPDAPKPGEPIVVDSDNDSDASEKILVRTPPKVKGETVDMGTYTLAEDTARGGPSGSVGNAVKLEPEADVEMVDDAAEIQEEARAERFERIGVIRTNITGIRYYNGMALSGELVRLIREPTNPYDRNAIRVDNSGGTQVGHVPKEVAAVLAPLVDRDLLRLEGEVAGARGSFTIPLHLHAWSLHENNNTIFNALKRGGVTLTQFRPLQNAQPPPSQADIAQEAWAKLLRSGEKLEPEQAVGLLADLGLEAKDLAKIPMAPQPDDMTTNLLPYQRQGLYWMLEAEHPKVPNGPKETTQFWQRKTDREGKPYFYNVTTMRGTQTMPKFMRGGVLADDMGLGKTIQILALILTDSTPKNIVRCDLPTSADYNNATLLVAPLSVIDGWRTQIAKHISPDRDFKIWVYHGDHGKKKTKKELAKYDLVITTYGTISQPGCELLKIQWRRVVLDEGHNVRTHTTKQSKACAAVKAERRWVVSGTPIQNGVDDIFGIIQFLGLEPLNDRQWWTSIFGRPVKKGDANALLKLKMLMQFLCLRRSKRMKFGGKPLIALPACNLYLHKVKFYPEEEKVYKALEQESRAMFREYEKRGDDEVMRNYANILEIILRLRQVCNHKDLIGDREIKFLDLIASGKAAEIDWNDPVGKKMISILRENESEDCCICFDTLKEVTITRCFHWFCGNCIKDVIHKSGNGHTAPCPMCRATVKEHELVTPPLEILHPPEVVELDDSSDEKDAEEEQDGGAPSTSSKIDALIQFLHQSHRKDPTTKSVVFSQWATMLNKIEPVLRYHNIDYVRFDGSMPVKKRDAAIQRFRTDKDCRVFLSTLKAGGLGLNLVEANQSFLMDPWWNPSIEDQAIDRIYRLGQTRECTVVRFVIDHTVEDRVMELQRRKRQLVKDAMGDGRLPGRDRAREQRLAELRAIFGDAPAAAGPQPAGGPTDAEPAFRAPGGRRAQTTDAEPTV